MTNKIRATIEERGKVYGDPYLSHVNIGLAWTALIQHHYGIELSHSIPASLVARMMLALKNQRSSIVYKEDNFIDAAAYLRFSEEFQQKEMKK